jgi:hypothetical protein
LRIRIELFAFTALLAGCAGPAFAPDEAPEYVTLREQTPLYQYGPAQGGPPDAFLAKDERVRLLRREFGYSLVQSAAGQTGYVGNMDLAPAPALPPPEPPVESLQPAEPAAVEPPLPKPDLDAPPADAPAVE